VGMQVSDWQGDTNCDVELGLLQLIIGQWNQSEISTADAGALHTLRYIDLIKYVGNIDTVIIRVKTPSSLVGGY
jgi:hypothetical protein